MSDKKTDDKKPSRGPEPDRVKVDIPWEEAVGKALKKKRPKGGWPVEKKGAK